MYDPADLHVYDPILTNFAVGFKPQNMYADLLAPITRIGTRKGQYRVFDRSHRLIYRSRREPGTEANTIRGRKWSTDEFHVTEHSLQNEIYPEETEELTAPGGLANPVFGGSLQVNPEEDAAEAVTESLDLERELKTATLFRDAAQYAGNHTTTLAGASKWSDYTGGVASTSDPVANIKTAISRIYLDTGMWPNRMIIPFDAVGVIENHPRVVARYQYTSVLDPRAWRLMLGLPEGVADAMQTFVVDSMYNNADNIDAAESIVSFWGQDVWIGVVDERDGLDVHTFAKTFARPYPTGDVRPVDRWYEPGRKVTFVRESFRYDLKVVSAAAGYLIKNAVVAVT